MKVTHRLFTAFIGTALVMGGLVSSPLDASVRPSNEASKPRSVCENSDGSKKTGALDVLLLLDNSKSLNSPKRASDPENKRYAAVNDLLVSLGNVSEGTEGQVGVDINFGAVSFGSEADLQIPFSPLNSKNASRTAAEVETKVPGKYEKQSNETNYIKALTEALRILRERPDNNCKFLVWFTDGQFESPDDSDPVEQRKQANRLKEAVCRPEGFADQFRNLRIHTFALVVKPTNTDSRLEASYGAMQAITGATVLPPDVESGIKGSKDMCGNLSNMPRLGEILIVDNAASIARRIPTIANGVGGWTNATACPISTDSDEMPKMPAARHLSRISFTAYEVGEKLEDLDKSRIRTNQNEAAPFSDYLVKVGESEFEQKFEFNDRAMNELNQGWSFEIGDGAVGWCVQILEHQFEVKFDSAGELGVAQSSEGGLLTEEDLRDLVFTQDDGVTALPGIGAARSWSGQVLAFLDIDPTEKLYEKPIRVKVAQLNRPSLTCSSLSLSANGDIPSNKRISTSCGIDTKNSNVESVSIAILPDENLKESECNSSLGIFKTSNGIALSGKEDLLTELVHAKGISTIHVVLEAQGSSAQCAAEGSMLRLTFDTANQKNQEIDIPISVNIKWKEVPSALAVWLLVILALLMAGLLNLLLLRAIKKKTSRISRSGLFAFEVPIKLVRNRSGQITGTTRDGAPLSSVVFDVAQQIAVKVDDGRLQAKLVNGSRSTLRVKPPALFKPFTASLMVLESNRTVYYSPAYENGAGLSPMTRQALIVHSPEPNGDTCNAMVTLLIPNSGPNRDEIVRELLVSRFASAMKPASNDGDWFAGLSGNASEVARPEIAEGIQQSDTSGLRPPRPGTMS